MPCEQTHENPAQKAIDDDLNTVYAPTVNGDKAEIIIDFNQTLTASGLKYTAGEGTPVGKYEVYVMENGEWICTADGTFKGSETVYFANSENKYISTYAATAVKFVISGQNNATVSISEIDVLGPTGDNVDFRRTNEENTTVIGVLGEDFVYGTEPEDVIPKDSIIFMGSYKGNPAYSTVLVYDKNGKIVGGKDSENNVKAAQTILADVPDGKDITDVSNGTWVYWIEPQYKMEMPQAVRAELYRVNEAGSNKGQRLVSDTLYETVPEELPTIMLNAD